MGMEALQAAIADYKRRHGEKVEEAEADDEHEGRIVCKCFGVTDTKIRKVALENNLHSVAEITDYTKAAAHADVALIRFRRFWTASGVNTRRRTPVRKVIRPKRLHRFPLFRK